MESSLWSHKRHVRLCPSIQGRGSNALAMSSPEVTEEEAEGEGDDDIRRHTYPQ